MTTFPLAFDDELRSNQPMWSSVPQTLFGLFIFVHVFADYNVEMRLLISHEFEQTSENIIAVTSMMLFLIMRVSS